MTYSSCAVARPALAMPTAAAVAVALEVAVQASEMVQRMPHDLGLRRRLWLGLCVVHSAASTQPAPLRHALSPLWYQIPKYPRFFPVAPK